MVMTGPGPLWLKIQRRQEWKHVNQWDGTFITRCLGVIKLIALPSNILGSVHSCTKVYVFFMCCLCKGCFTSKIKLCRATKLHLHFSLFNRRLSRFCCPVYSRYSDIDRTHCNHSSWLWDPLDPGGQPFRQNRNVYLALSCIDQSKRKYSTNEILKEMLCSVVLCLHHFPRAKHEH